MILHFKNVDEERDEHDLLNFGYDDNSESGDLVIDDEDDERIDTRDGVEVRNELARRVKIG